MDWIIQVENPYPTQPIWTCYISQIIGLNLFLTP